MWSQSEVYMITVASAPMLLQESGGASKIATAADVAIIFVALALIVLIVVLIVTIIEVRKGHHRMLDMIRELRIELEPMVSSANAVGSNLVEISEVAKRRAAAVESTLAEADMRLNDAMEVASSRVRSFDALLQVIHEEVESTFVRAVATVRGVEEGVRGLVGGAFWRRGGSGGSREARRGERRMARKRRAAERASARTGRSGSRRSGSEGESDAAQESTRNGWRADTGIPRP